MSIWNPWTYSDYKKSVEHDVSYGMKRHGFTVGGAISYAHVELELRLDKFPAENVMALTALAIAANQRGVLSLHTVDDEFYEDLVKAYANGEHLASADSLNLLQKQEFLHDVGVVSEVLDICRTGGNGCGKCLV